MHAEYACIFAGGKRRHLSIVLCFVNDLLKTAIGPSSHLPADSALQNEGGFRSHWRRVSAADCLRFQQPVAALLLEARRGQTGCENLSWALAGAMPGAFEAEANAGIQAIAQTSAQSVLHFWS